MKILRVLVMTVIICISVFINNFIYAVNDNYPIDENLKQQVATKTPFYVDIKRIPEELVWKIIFAEDNKFYEHKGYSIIGLVKSFLTHIKEGQMHEDSQTITQELANNLFLSQDKTMNRKLKELVLVVQLERYYSKDEILEMYLNVTNFGLGTTGIQEASQKYFQKNTWDLTTSECEHLANSLWT